VNRLREREGFTLVETMFSMALFSMAVVFLYSTFVVNTRIYVLENDVLELQQSTRVAMDEIAREVFMAGSGVPQGAIPSDMGFLFAVMPAYGGTGSPDSLRFLRGDTGVQTSLSSSMTSRSSPLAVNDGSMFSAGDVVLIQGNTVECGESLELFQVTQVVNEGGLYTLEHRPSPPWNQDDRLSCTFMAPSTLTKVRLIRYAIDESDPLHPLLVKTIDEGASEVIARDIENFKVTYDLLNGMRGIKNPPDPNLIRKINFSLVGRTQGPDDRWAGGIHSLTGESDNYRRYRLNTQVFIRNIES
jgi:prepilin-type N-terminal cleavage/methylation domain-containing protein